MPTVTINDLDGGVLAFDLRDVLRVLAPSSERATWTITHPDESPFEATGGAAPRRSLCPIVAVLSLWQRVKMFTYDDFVAVRCDAPVTFRPGQRASVIAIFGSEDPIRKTGHFSQFPAGTVYSVEFEDGEALEIHEAMLEPAEERTCYGDSASPNLRFGQPSSPKRTEN